MNSSTVDRRTMSRGDEQRRARRAWLRRWALANGLGEMVGLGLGVALAMPVHARLDGAGPVLAVLAGSTLFAVVEGTAVGVAQFRVLAGLAPAVGLWRWWLATVTGGWLAWVGISSAFAGMAGAAAEGAAEPALLVQLMMMSVAGLVAGPVLGVPQAFALRRVHPRPWSWIPANSLAWAAGLPLVQLVAGGADTLGVPLSGPWLGLVGAVVLFVTGVVVGGIHGPTLYRLLTDRPAPTVESPVESHGERRGRG